jgi:hypothetical protein
MLPEAVWPTIRQSTARILAIVLTVRCGTRTILRVRAFEATTFALSFALSTAAPFRA